MHLAIAELDRHRDVFGAAFGAQFIELRKGARFGAVQPEPERPALAIDDRDRAAAKRGGIEDAVGRLAECHAGTLSPLDAAAQDLRMQGAHKERYVPERNTDCEQSFAHFGEDRIGCLGGRRAVDEPLAKGGDVRCCCRHAPMLSPYLSRWRNQYPPASLRPFGARSSHWYMPQRPSSPRAYAE